MFSRISTSLFPKISTSLNVNLFHTSTYYLDRPYRVRGGPIAIHAASRPPEDSNIDFSALDLTYPLTVTPEVIVKQYYWTTPPTSMPGLPFEVERTFVGSSLPVYTEYKHGRTKVQTILRKCRGDILLLKNEMEKVCGKPIIVRPGKLVVDGNYNMRLKKWLAGLGF